MRHILLMLACLTIAVAAEQRPATPSPIPPVPAQPAQPTNAAPVDIGMRILPAGTILDAEAVHGVTVGTRHVGTSSDVAPTPRPLGITAKLADGSILSSVLQVVPADTAGTDIFASAESAACSIRTGPSSMPSGLTAIMVGETKGAPGIPVSPVAGIAAAGGVIAAKTKFRLLLLTDLMY